MANQVFHYSNIGVSSGQRFYLKDEVSGLYLNNLNIISDSSIDAGIQGLNGSSLTRRDFVSNMLLFNGLTVPDQDAAAYIASVMNTGATITSGQKSAIDTFVKAEKAASRWNGIKRFYLPVWGNAAANAICMKTLTSATFVGAMTHGSGYISSTGGILATNTTLPALGITVESHHVSCLSKSSTSDDFQLVLSSFPDGISFGCGDAEVSARTMNRQIASEYPFRGIYSYGGNRTSRYLKQRLSSGVSTSTTTSSVVGDFGDSFINLMGASVESSYFPGEIGAISMGTSLSDAQDTEYTANLKTLWETTTSLTLP